MAAKPSQDDRIMATLAHVTTIMPFLGIIGPIVIWITQREKSEYVAFHALQALAYQLTMLLGWFVGMGCYMCSFILVFAGTASLPTGRTAPAEFSDPAALFGLGLMFSPFIVFAAIVVAGAAFVLYGLVGTVQTFRGKTFRYFMIGKWVERHLQNSATS